MSSRQQLLRVLGLPTDVETGLTRLEKSLFELRDDVDTAVQVFLAKNQRVRELLHLPGSTDDQSPPGDALDKGPSPGALPPRSASPEGSELATPATLAAPLAPVFDLASTYVVLSPSGSASPIEVTPEFWTYIDERQDLAQGRLVAIFACNEDWAHWEMHPHGEEVLVLLSGRITLIVEHPDGDESVEMKQGTAWLVPRGAWHRAIVDVPGKLLAITYGRGTEHRPR
jgi:mannose-6-phosphate isomerase-like protein (cupin superfamily)